MSVDYPKFDETRPCYGRYDIFTPDSPNARTEAAAKAVCAGCDFLVTCREYALSHDVYGVWAGLTAGERKKLRGSTLAAIPRQRIRGVRSMQ